MKEFKFSKSKTFVEEYSALICRIDKVTPIENSDFLAKVTLSGYDMVVRKDQVKEGDIKIYCPVETMLNADFLSANNLYDMPNYEKNSNHKEVESLRNDGKTDEAKSKVGFFNKYGRVRMIRLRGQESMGFIISPEDFIAWKPNFTMPDLEKHIGESFDEVNDELFIKVYIPPVKDNGRGDGQKFFRKRMKRIKKFDRIIPGTFSLHYDTGQFSRFNEKLQPNDVINISEKMHGTSFILANIPVKRKLSFIEKIKRILGKNVPLTEYDIVYSSRNVIKNQYINPKQVHDFYGTDLWGEIRDNFGKFVQQDMTVYGECIGWLTGSKEKCIQKVGSHNYTYGCNPGCNRIMIYRVVTTRKNEDGSNVKYDWNVSEITKWISCLIEDNPALKDYVSAPTTFYHGPAKDLYKDIDTTKPKWQDEMLEKMKTDVNFLMEQDEPTCPKGTPAEGIVIRKDDDPMSEAWKLKSKRFLSGEAKDIDNGIVDSETAEAYNNEEK